MILRSFELNKISKDAIFHLVYGTNEGLKTECINEILKKNNARVFSYDEIQIEDQEGSFYENILSGSLFDKNKIIIIKRATDKICNTIEDLIDRNITNVKKS